jgi:hypothetical protein
MAGRPPADLGMLGFYLDLEEAVIVGASNLGSFGEFDLYGTGL